tara:strand:- start:178 stop:393 length:216 start_codon:yes stop_codon:yes gene_type:complete
MGKQITRPKTNSMRKLEMGGWTPRTKIQVKDKNTPKGIQVLVFSKMYIIEGLPMIQNGFYIARTIYCGMRS